MLAARIGVRHPTVPRPAASARPVGRAHSATASKAPSFYAPLDTFARRHHGDDLKKRGEMLRAVGFDSLDAFEAAVVPAAIRISRPLKLSSGADKGESDVLSELKSIAKNNVLKRTFIGQGYYGTLTPPVILRNLLENPGWYTSYTPYQAEISQGRLESLLNYQTMVADLTGLPFTNASLLDEGTAAAEALNMCHSATESERHAVFVADDVHPQTLAVVQGRCKPLNIKVHVGSPDKFDFQANKVSGALVQYPNTYGAVGELSAFSQKVHASGAMVVCATDLLALTLLKPPGEQGVDIAVGSAQRFGVPMGYGGPHAAFLACGSQKLQRKMPGRIIGVSKDSRGQPALRMALQTREQHIRREKATSNICTAQALLANIAAMYAVYHGPQGLRAIAQRTHRFASVLAEAAKQAGHQLQATAFFDTVTFTPKGKAASAIVQDADAAGINVRLVPGTPAKVSVAFDETVTQADLRALISIVNPNYKLPQEPPTSGVPQNLFRSSSYLTHPVFNTYHTEHEMLRYMHKLESKDLALNRSMITLGSCTMKLNATSEMIPITWPEFGQLHPFAPAGQAKGYATMVQQLERALAEITGFAACSLQPNSGASGEYAGLLAIQS